MISEEGDVVQVTNAPVQPVAAAKKLTIHHAIVFVVTFCSYSLFHATRKVFSNVKTTLSKQWSPTNTCSSESFVFDEETWNRHTFFADEKDAAIFLGALDMVFMTAYALGLFISGFLGDRYDLRKVLRWGMWLSAIMVFFFGVLTEWLEFYNSIYYIVFWMLSGFAQSAGWPAVVAIMGNWFGKSSRGIVFGLWGACASVGNIIGAQIVAAVLHYGYQWAFVVPASLLFVGGIVVSFSLVPSPNMLGIAVPDDEDENELPMNQEDASTLGEEEPLLGANRHIRINSDLGQISEEGSALGFFEALLLPGVIAYSLAYACLKLVNYSFFFWLPYYLTSNFNWAEDVADRLSTWYDVGGVVGGIISGFISDKMIRRSPTVVAMLLISPIVLYFYSVSPRNQLVNAILMSITGFFISGCSNLISTAISADLGRQKTLRGNSKALSTVTGIVDGTGSLGAALGQLVVPLMGTALGWKSVFYLFIALTLMTTVCIMPIFVRDMHYYWTRLKIPDGCSDGALPGTSSDNATNASGYQGIVSLADRHDVPEDF